MATYNAEARFRVDSEILMHKSWHQTAVWMRKYHCAELSSFLLNPDAVVEKGALMKDGPYTTVVRTQFGGGGGGGGDYQTL